jgi:hypothetical protein
MKYLANWLFAVTALCASAAAAQVPVVNHTALTPAQIPRTRSMSPTSGVDLGEQINAALPASCVAGGQGNNILIPAGTYTWNTQVSPNCPYVNLIGAGASVTNINTSIPTPLNLHSTAANFDYARGNTIEGLHFKTTNPAAAVINAGDVIAASFLDLAFDGPGNSGEAFHFQNQNHWMERAYLQEVEIAGFAHNLHFYAPTSPGTDSFGYWTVNTLWTNQVGGSCGVQIDRGAAVYHVTGWAQTLNSQGTTAADYAFCIGGAFDGTGFRFTGENFNAPIGFAHLLAGGEMVFAGDYHTFGNAGAIREKGAGRFFIGPFSGDGVEFSTEVDGTIANFGGTNQTVDVMPVETLGGLGDQDPSKTAQRGYVVSHTPNPTGGSSSAPFDVYDPFIPRCFGTLQGMSVGQNISQAVPTFCVDGVGNIIKVGGASFTGPVNIEEARSGLIGTWSSSQKYGLHRVEQQTASPTAAWTIGVNGPAAPNSAGCYVYTTDASLHAIPQLAMCSRGIASPSITAGAGGFIEKLYTPESSSAPCSPGQFADDSNFHYVCTAPNTWKRVALSSF